MTVALVWNPNTGKSTLFNALTGYRQRVGNFPGTTVERRTGRIRLGGQAVELLDLPGLYSLAAAKVDPEIVPGPGEFVGTFTALALVWLTRKNVESWVLWLLPVNVCAIHLCSLTGSYMFAALYVVFLVNAGAGLKNRIYSAAATAP